MLKQVTIKPTDTCVSYALKRIGVHEEYPQVQTFGDLKHAFGVGNFPDVSNYFIMQGDLLVWDKNIEMSYKPISINDHGEIEYLPMFVGAHVVVIENVITVDGRPVIIVSGTGRAVHGRLYLTIRHGWIHLPEQFGSPFDPCAHNLIDAKEYPWPSKYYRIYSKKV